MDVWVLGFALLLFVLVVEKSRPAHSVPERDQRSVHAVESAAAGHCHQKGKGNVDTPQVVLGLLDRGLRDCLRCPALLPHVKHHHPNGLFRPQEYLIEGGLFLLHAVVQTQRLVPLGEGPFEGARPLHLLLDPQLHKPTHPVQVLPLVSQLLVRPALVGHCVEKSVPVHVHLRLLAEEPLPVPAQPVESCSGLKTCHLLLVDAETILLLLELLDTIERLLPYRQVAGRADVQVDLKLVDLALGLDAVGHLRAQLPLLSEQVLEEDDDRGLHLFEDVLVHHFLSDLVPWSPTGAGATGDRPQVFDLVDDPNDVLEDYLWLIGEDVLSGVEVLVRCGLLNVQGALLLLYDLEEVLTHQDLLLPQRNLNLLQLGQLVLEF